MNSVNDASGDERRLLSRIDASMRINYQLITREDALRDPYDPYFVLPRYFLMLAELDQLDTVLTDVSAGMRLSHPQTMQVLDLFNQKLNLITTALYDAMVDSMLPTPTRVNLSESGLSFYARDQLEAGQHLHLTLSHPSRSFHVATTARVVYSEDEDLEGFRTGAYFISLHPSDRARLAESINRKREDEQALDALQLSNPGPLH